MLEALPVFAWRTSSHHSWCLVLALFWPQQSSFWRYCTKGFTPYSAGTTDTQTQLFIITKILTTHSSSVTPTVLDSITNGLIWTAIYARPNFKKNKNFREGKYIFPNPCLSPNIMYTDRIHFTIHFIHGPEKRIQYSDWLQSARSGDQIPMGARFSVPVLTGPGAHPASYTIGAASFLRLKRPGSEDNPLPSSTEVKEKV